jgi:hypothetical protein
VLVIFAALAVAIMLRREAPPEVARLLPESDAIVYADLKPLRVVAKLQERPVRHSPEYQHFIDATGIVPERDLDSVAFALHRMDDPTGPNGAVGYSEVFEGHFDGSRLKQYLRSIASAHEQYAGHEVFTIPVEDEAGARVKRQLRVAQLGYDTVAASNMPTAEQIHLILDRHRAAASPFSGSSLLATRYREVPLLSSAWAIGHVGLPFSERGYITVFGLQLPIPEDTTFVASLRYVGSLHLRIEEIASSEAEAAKAAESLGALLGLVKSIESSQPRAVEDAELKAVLDSLKVDRRKERAVVTATIPLELVKRISSGGGIAPQ